MKRTILIAVGVIVLVGGLGYFIPRLISVSTARPLYGNFDRGIQCMGGHEIFLFLDETQAYKHCPGHRNLDPMGPITRTASSVTIHNVDDNTPRLRIDYTISGHTITSATEGWSESLPQVSDPWRTWLPTLLPE